MNFKFGRGFKALETHGIYGELNHPDAYRMLETHNEPEYLWAPYITVQNEPSQFIRMMNKIIEEYDQ